MTLRPIPEAYGGGWLVGLWGKECERKMTLSFVHFPLSLDRKTLAETSHFH